VIAASEIVRYSCRACGRRRQKSFTAKCLAGPKIRLATRGRKLARLQTEAKAKRDAYLHERRFICPDCWSADRG